MPTAKGPFEVKLAPLEAYNSDPTAKVGRMSLDKIYRGDIEGTSKGEMLSTMGEVQGSAAAVAVERVTGPLAGKSGSFALYHVGVMEAGVPKYWRVNIAPDSIHQAQLLSYLKHSGKRLGLVINFNTVLLKNGIRRVISG